MSWAVSVVPTIKSEFSKAIDELPAPPELQGPVASPDELAVRECALAQFNKAKKVAKELGEFLPGPFLGATFNGHANASGFRPNAGMASEYVEVYVTQYYEPLKS